MSTNSTVVMQRRFSTPGQDPLASVTWTRRPSTIRERDGKVVFHHPGVEVPEAWSSLATDIAASKYLRRTGVPGSGAEDSIRQMIVRVVDTLAAEAVRRKLVAPGEDQQIFRDELAWLLVHQRGAFNSPVWFNLGLFHAYGIRGGGGNFAWDDDTRDAIVTSDAYSRPQVSACFIQSVDDDLGSIFELARNEARVFKFGSGTGTNFSRLRAACEPLSGGGRSSGLLSFLEVLDRGAGATKSGGTTRRAAKMVVVDVDHPEIESFVQWKAREERKVAALIAAGYPSDYEGEAYRTVAAQNANHSVRVTDAFLQAVMEDAPWALTARTTGEVVDTIPARKIWQSIAESAWRCADPGLQFHDTIQRWHTCAASGPIRASNPCSEYLFLDDTACNLASLNLLSFLSEDRSQNVTKDGGIDIDRGFDVDGFRHACRLFLLAQEAMVDLASYPTAAIARRSHEFRTLGLGYANLGALLTALGLPYDSETGRGWAAGVTSLMTGETYALSAELAALVGPFDGYEANRASMQRVIDLHRQAAAALDAATVPVELQRAGLEAWERATQLGRTHGFRNAQVTVLAPTGTIGLLMDCDTTGVEPDFSLVKHKKLAGGGTVRIVNGSVSRALTTLGYSAADVSRILEFALGTHTLSDTPGLSPSELHARGIPPAEVGLIESVLRSGGSLSESFHWKNVSDGTRRRLGGDVSGAGPLWQAIGLTPEQWEAARERVDGAETLEGAPGLRPEHVAVFDCANRCGRRGTRFIAPAGHLHMMAAIQPFLSGAISKTVNLPHDATVEDIERVYFDAWRMGIKAIAVYRDGSKWSQPLVSSSGGSTAPTASTSNRSSSSTSTFAQNSTSQSSTAGGPLRQRLPTRRRGVTQEVRIGGMKLFVRTGEYGDGRLGEIFIDMHKEGAAYRSMLNCFAMLTSIALQYGVPLDVLVDQFVFTRFEPQGAVQGHDRIKRATSVVDFVFRMLGVEYLGRDDLAHLPRDTAENVPTLAVSDTPEARAAVRSAPLSMLEDTDPVDRPETPDAPFCDVCGHVTVRNGTCFKCLNCGTSLGCS